MPKKNQSLTKERLPGGLACGWEAELGRESNVDADGDADRKNRTTFREKYETLCLTIQS